MSLRLRPGLSWCRCADRAVFVDLEHDRYFCLPEAADACFRRWADGAVPDPDDEALLLGCSVAEAGNCSSPQAAPRLTATRDHALAGTHRPRLADMAAAVAGQLLARWWLRRRPIAGIAAHLARQGANRSGRVPDEVLQRRIAGAFVASALLLRATDQCLPRAIAAWRLCRRHGQQAALVLGVRLDPFAAHSWVQCGDAVIVGDLEQVRLYTPILVLP
jgi:Transglutaminase-like superfamily